VRAVGIEDETGDGTPVALVRDELAFAAAGEDGFRDAETGSTWNVLGLATAGPLAGEQLPGYRHVDTFWHSWVAFQPETTILR
jgi:hypothetical protein